MKAVFILAITLMAVQAAEAQMGLPEGLSSLTVDCKEVSGGEQVQVHNTIYGMSSDRSHQQTLDVEFQNLGNKPLKASAVVYFLYRNDAHPDTPFVEEPVTDDLDLGAGASAQWTATSEPIKEHVENYMIMGKGDRSGGKPMGWIMGCKVGEVFYPLKASSEPLMDYAQTDAFKTGVEMARRPN
jgi:hypothetical protein